MSYIKILLKKKIESLGNEGSIVKVKSGYARNYLLPNKFAIIFNKYNEKLVNHLLKQKETRENKELQDAELIANQLKEVTLEFFLKKQESNSKLFGSITSLIIKNEINNKFNINIIKEKIKLEHPIKDLGEHKINIKLHEKITITINIVILAK